MYDDGDELDWYAAEEWHPMFRAHLGQILGPGGSEITMDYTDYWAAQRDAEDLPEVWE